MKDLSLLKKRHKRKKMPILSNSNVIAFVPSTNLNESKLFYKDKLGLTLKSFDEIALEFKINEVILRVTKVSELTPASYTIFGWNINDIDLTIKELSNRGIQFEKFNGFSQSDLGVCTFPDGGKVAWFKDPDGNTLSITQFVN